MAEALAKMPGLFRASDTCGFPRFLFANITRGSKRLSTLLH
jgi:hypothetical protein